ncbi:MAG: hypothetical protein ABSF44_08875 [Candidatus Bathyarchaeia archaeon]|jgi:hypothetical protein
MNLKLYAVKRGNQNLDSSIQLVVDLDRGKHYLLNFVCILPRYLRLLEKRSSNFGKIFGKESISVATQLLDEAKHTEDDPDIQKSNQQTNKRYRPKTKQPNVQPHFCLNPNQALNQKTNSKQTQISI